MGDEGKGGGGRWVKMQPHQLIGPTRPCCTNWQNAFVS